MQNHKKVANSEHITVKSDKKIFKVSINDICYIQAYGDYIKVFLIDKMLLVHQTLKDFFEQLPQNIFIRIHKSYIINLNHIEFLEGNQISILATRLPISQSYKNDLWDKL